ncbi:MAG: hypothetical protein AAGC81_08640 [Pseudomonadota bacterium]
MRSPEAESDFKALSLKIEECLTPSVGIDDQDVNHPDTFTARLYRIGDTEVSISLKDKASLGQTLIFLRAAGTKVSE